MCDERGLDPWIEVDGGLKVNNTWQVLEAGAKCYRGWISRFQCARLR